MIFSGTKTIVPFAKSNIVVLKTGTSLITNGSSRHYIISSFSIWLCMSWKQLFHLLKLIRSSYLIVNHLFHILKMMIRLSYFAPSKALFTLDQHVSIVQTIIDHDWQVASTLFYKILAGQIMIWGILALYLISYIEAIFHSDTVVNVLKKSAKLFPGPSRTVWDFCKNYPFGYW